MSQGTLWAKVDNEAQNTISMKKAMFFAFWVQLAMIAGFMSIDFQKRWDDIRKTDIMKAVLEPPPPPPEEKKEEPPPPPPPPKEKPKEQPKDIQEAAPIPIEAPVANTSSSTSTVSVPVAVAPVQQGTGEMKNEPPPKPAAPRGLGDLSNRRACATAILAGYPREARRAGQTGTVTLLLTVGADGSVLRADVKDSNPRRVFDRAAVSAIMSGECKFKSGGDQSTFEVPIVYKLGDDVEEEK